MGPSVNILKYKNPNNIKPVIAILGRPNVGKSTLFNKILGKNAAIVDDLPGVTRDLHYEDMVYEDKPFTLIDTGGFHIDEVGDAITAGIKRQIEEVLDSVDGVILLLDGAAGPNPSDKEMFLMIKKMGVRHWATVTKIDGEGRESWTSEFYEMGAEEVFAVSGTTGYGVYSFLDELTRDFWTLKEMKEKLPPPEDEIKVAVVGRPNVGKSTLVNTILGEEKMLVSPIAGTTTDPIDSVFRYKEKKFRIIDTAGVRRKKNIELVMEKAAVLRAFRAIDRCDVVVFLMDANEPAPDQDLRILGLAHDKNKGIIIAINKWDTVEKDDKTFDKLVLDIRDRVKFAPYAPVISISALKALRTTKLLDLVMEIQENYLKTIDQDTLTEWLHKCIKRQPPRLAKYNRLVVFRTARMDSARPPTVIICVNKPTAVHFSYERYLINQFYEEFGFAGVAVKFIFKK